MIKYRCQQTAFIKLELTEWHWNGAINPDLITISYRVNVLELHICGSYIICAFFVFRLPSWTQNILPPSDLHDNNLETKLLFISSLHFTFFPTTTTTDGYDPQREHGTSTVYSILRSKACSAALIKRNHYALMSHIVDSINCTYSISLNIRICM